MARLRTGLLSEIVLMSLDTLRTSKMRSALTVLGHVHDISEDEFDRIAQGTRDGCPISRAIAGNVELTVEATLETDA